MRKLPLPQAARLAALLLPCLAGCAVTTTLPDGTRAVVGFVYLTTPPASAGDDASSLRVRTLGFSLTQAFSGTALSLGWTDTTLAEARGASCLAIETRR